MFVIVILAALFFSVASYKLAKRYNRRSPGAAAFFGLMFGPFTLLMIWAIGPKKTRAQIEREKVEEFVSRVPKF